MDFTRFNLDRLRRTKPARQTTIWDKKETGLCVLWSPGPAGKKNEATVTLRCVFYLRDKPGVPQYTVIGRYPDGKLDTYKDGKGGKEHVIRCFNLATVRAKARRIRDDAKQQNIDPRRPRLTGEFKSVVDEFIEEHVKKTRSHLQTERIFNTYILPEWGDRHVEEIKKSDVALLLGKIRSGKIKLNGDWIGTPSVAVATLARLSKLFNWYSARHATDNYHSPIRRDMRERDDVPKPRDRFLSDDELRALWKACDAEPIYGSVIKVALLTAQRFHQIGRMKRSDIKDKFKIQGRFEGEEWIPDRWVETVWDPTRADEPKNKRTSVVPLSGMTKAIIDAVPIINAGTHDFVFSLSGNYPLSDWSLMKKRLDTRMLSILKQQAKEAGDNPNKVELVPWQHRDLRRTARTLMARAKVARDIAEHCLGHSLGRIESVYNRHDFVEEKKEAFDKLAALVTRIVSGDPNANVVKLTSRR